MNKTEKRIWNSLKERRFTTTARILGEQKAINANVRVVSQTGGHAAWWQANSKTIVLNDAVPATKSAKLTLTWERAKLFHELFHLMFTDNERQRAKLAAKSSNQKRFLWISNALEDGRIEYHGGKIYAGTIWYIRTLLKECVRDNSPDSGLLIYVRTHLWRNAAEGAFWSKYQRLIDEAITADSSATVNQNAFDIVEDMEAAKPKQPQPQPTQEPQQEGEQEEPQQDEGEGDNEGEGESEESESESESENGSESREDSENDVECEDEGEDSGEGEESDSAESSDSGTQSEPSEPPTEPPTDNHLDESIRDEIDELIDEAMDAIDQEVTDELVELKEEFSTYEQPQEYLDAVEENDANQVAELFASLLVESERQKFEPCKRGGTLDGRRLIETRTDGVYMHERIKALSQPHIVLLVDESCSMCIQAQAVSAAARVLNGAIKDSGAKSLVISFGARCGGSDEDIIPRSVVPVEGFRCAGFETPTGRGLRAAHDWLEREAAKRGMVIVITDGIPTSVHRATMEFEALRNNGYYVLDVLLGEHAKKVKPETLRAMSHEYVYIENPKDLVRELETPLGNFITGAF
jgi:Mg-chelatase subunit ChlD